MMILTMEMMVIADDDGDFVFITREVVSQSGRSQKVFREMMMMMICIYCESGGLAIGKVTKSIPSRRILKRGDNRVRMHI